MRILNRLIPAFLRDFDKKLLLRKPVLWTLKLHYWLFWQLVLSAVMLLFSWVLPQSIGNFPNYDFISTVFVIIEVLMYLLWCFVTFQFDIRTRNIGKPWLFEQYRIASHFIAIVAIIANVLAVNYILHNNTRKTVEPISYDEWRDISSDINDFQGNVSHYAQGYRWEYVFDSTLMKRVRDTLKIPIDTVMERCETIGSLNGIYGDGTTYSADEVYLRITDTSYFYTQIDNSGYYRDRDHFLGQLYANENQISNSYRHVTYFWSSLWEAIVPYWLLLCTLLTIILFVIYSFKFFGIYQLITAVLAPTLLFVILAILAFSFDEFFNIDFEDNLLPYAILLGVFSIWILIANMGNKHSTKKRIVVIQTLVFLLPFSFVTIYFEVFYHYIDCYSYLTPAGVPVNYTCEGCLPNPDYDLCLRKEQLFRNLTATIMSFMYLFIAFAAVLKTLYKQYYLPWNK
jgi:hypothetical protein